jgi:hypothetical protein
MNRILRYFRAKRFDRDLKAEIDAHLEEKVDQFIEDGLAPDAARVKALRQFGNRTHAREDSRRQWAYEPLDEIVQNLQYAFRVFSRSPVFTTVAVLSLALGV